jgi:hypothetical protein
MPYQSAGCCYTHFMADVMINGFVLSNWNYNDDSDLSFLSYLMILLKMGTK